MTGSTAHALLVVAGQTAAIYLFLVVTLRLVGYRTLGQLTVVDLVIVIVLGSAVETSMVAGNTSLPAGLVSATTLLAINRLIALLARSSPGLRRILLGSPVLLYYKGHLLEEHLRRAGLTEADVIEAVHERGEPGLETVQYIVRELDGTLNVVPVDSDAMPNGARKTPAGGEPEEGA